MSKGMPIETPDNTIMGLFEGAHLLVPISEPEENGALGTSTSKERLMHWMPGNSYNSIRKDK
jgi:hypothetical protein